MLLYSSDEHLVNSLEKQTLPSAYFISQGSSIEFSEIVLHHNMLRIDIVVEDFMHPSLHHTAKIKQYFCRGAYELQCNTAVDTCMEVL